MLTLQLYLFKKIQGIVKYGKINRPTRGNKFTAASSFLGKSEAVWCHQKPTPRLPVAIGMHGLWVFASNLGAQGLAQGVDASGLVRRDRGWSTALGPHCGQSPGCFWGMARALRAG